METNNKERFRELLQKAATLKPEKANGINKLLDWLETTDFYIAPASIKYNGNIDEGLCAEAIQTYDTLEKLNITFNENLDEYSILIISLLHNLGRINNFKKVIKGAYKKDENGVTIQPKIWEEKEARDYNPNPEMVLNEEIKSIFFIQHFIKLSLEEAEAISAFQNFAGCSDKEIGIKSKILSKNKLALYLHLANIKNVYYSNNADNKNI